MLYVKPADMSYTDIAIWIDEHKETENQTEQFFNYLYCLCEMITRKRGYFQTESDKDDFSCYLAQIVFDRYKNIHNQPKSVLNYIKGIIKYKKIDYTREFWQENINLEVLTGRQNNHYISELDDKLVEPMASLLRTEFMVYLTTIDDTIKSIVNSYGIKDSVLKKNILISCFLSFINATTLPIKYIDKIEKICRTEDIKEKALYRAHKIVMGGDYIIFYHIEDEDDKELLHRVIEDVMGTIQEEMTSMVDEQYSLCECADDIKSEFLHYLADEDYDDDSALCYQD